jgi:hypothetical protein
LTILVGEFAKMLQYKLQLTLIQLDKEKSYVALETGVEDA